MGKKPYIKPQVIDIGLEGMTGIGAGVMAINCSAGTDYSDVFCNIGWGYSSGCGRGNAPTAGCTNGSLPHHRAGYCQNGSSTTGICYSGSGITGPNSSCLTGVSPSLWCLSGSSPAYTHGCALGEDDALCDNGNRQLPFDYS